MPPILIEWLAKPLVKVGLVLLALGLVVALYFAWRGAANDAASKAQQVRASQITQKSTTATATAAVSTVQDTAQKAQATDAKTQHITNNYYSTYPQASAAPVDPALFAAFRASICMYSSAANLPECQPMQPVPAPAVP